MKSLLEHVGCAAFLFVVLLCLPSCRQADAMMAAAPLDPADPVPAEKPAVPEPGKPDAPEPEKHPSPKPPPKPLTLDQVLDNMEAARKKLTTYQAQVIKLRRIEVLEETEKFAGTIRFKMPRLLRLELKEVKKGSETIYIVGETYGWIVRPQRNHAERAKLTEMDSKAESANPLEYGLAKDIHELRKAYAIKLLPVEKISKVEALPLELTPKKKQYATGKLTFWIDPKTWLPVQLREYKSNDEIVETHTFSNPVVNKKIKDKVFRFKPPRDMDVIIHDAQ